MKIKIYQLRKKAGISFRYYKLMRMIEITIIFVNIVIWRGKGYEIKN